MGTDRDRRRKWMLTALIRIPPHHLALCPPPFLPLISLHRPSSDWEPHFSGHFKGYDKKSKRKCVCMIDTLSNDMNEHSFLSFQYFKHENHCQDLCNTLSLILSEHISADVWKPHNSNVGTFTLHFKEEGVRWAALASPGRGDDVSKWDLCTCFRMSCITGNLQIISKINTFKNTTGSSCPRWGGSVAESEIALKTVTDMQLQNRLWDAGDTLASCTLEIHGLSFWFLKCLLGCQKS